MGFPNKVQSIKSACRQGRALKLQEEIFQTLAYADIFDYPLTENEIFKWLISIPLTSSNPPLTSLNNPLKSLKEDLLILIKRGEILLKNGFYCLPNREKTIFLRTQREKWSLEKSKIANKTAQKLKKFTWVKMVGITGALAMNNCQKNDDIDLMIITSKNRLWLTRLLLLIFSPLLGIKRRKPKENNPNNKICFNLFLDENYLTIEPKNLFIAHEICQVIPLVNKDKTYEIFLRENKWVVKFLPNAVNISTKHKAQSTKEKNLLISQYLNICLPVGKVLISILEKLAFKLQYSYMKSKITNEKISVYQAFFHPENIENKIIGKYNFLIRKRA